MAKRKKGQVPRDNVAELRIGDIELELEASLGTGIAYAREFRGKLEEPYVGSLGTDLLTVWRYAQQSFTQTVAADEDGTPIMDEDGRYVYDPNGKEVRVPNPDYIGYDVEALLRIAWAMAWAAGSTEKRYEEFYESVVHQSASSYEEAGLYYVVVIVLGGGIIFRGPEGRGGAEEPDAQEAEAEGR